MSRGKPGPDQLDLSMDMLDVFNSKSELKSENGFDSETMVLWMVFLKQRS